MENYREGMRRKIGNAFATVLLGILIFVSAYSQTSQSAAKPDRGAGSTASYALSDIERINLENGNVNLSIPLASLPPVAGGKLGFTLRAIYNSKLHDTFAAEGRVGPGELGSLIYTWQVPTHSELGGWRIGDRYNVTIELASSDFARLGDTGDPDLQLLTNQHKTYLITPDGSKHELRPIDYSPWAGSNPTYNGYFAENNAVPVRYYSFDGSYLWARINPLGSSISFEVYQADGTKIIQWSDGVQRIMDANGNSIKIFTNAEGTHYQDEQTGREIKYSLDSSGVGHVSYQTVGGLWVTTDINFGSTSVRGKAYDITRPCNPDQPDCFCTYQAFYARDLLVIREIVLPSTEPAVPRRKFVFSYNSDTDNPNPGTFTPACLSNQDPILSSSFGNGQLSQMQAPNGEVVEYSYALDGTNLIEGATNLAAESVTSKTLIHDGTTEVWTYAISETSSSVNNPDGSSVVQQSYFHGPAFLSVMGGSNGLGGLVYRINRSGKELTERHWTRLKFDGGQEDSPGGGKVVFNPVVDFEYTSLLDANGNAVKMSARAFQYDFNGNMLQETDYDWFDPSLVTRDVSGVPTGIPGSASVLRTISNVYYNAAITSNSTNVYAKRSLSATTPQILNALQQTTAGTAISQFSYDSQPYGTAPTIGNVTSQRTWDDLDSKWITGSQTYNSYGNVLSKIDPLGNITQFFYDDATHALPTRVTVDPQNGTGTQTTTTVFDFYTGLVTSQIDPNSKASTIDYTNQLLGTVDPFGRPGVTIGPMNASGQRHRVTMTYLDSTRQIIVASDLNSENDQLLKSRTTVDMLGRVVLAEQSEDGTSYTIAIRKAYDLIGRTTYVSNPMRATAASTDGWIRTTVDELGRVIAIATFPGASQPTASATNWSGKLSTDYDANKTTVTDQAGKTRSSDIDAIGRLVNVVEDPGDLAYQTNYTYDALSNLVKVSQGSQQRYFMYDSLSRLRRARNPEQDNYSSLNLSDPVTGNSQWSIAYDYDDNGNLRVKTDARGVSTHFSYDALNRAVRRWYNGSSSLTATVNNSPVLPAGVSTSPEVTYSYDAVGVANSKGRLTSVISTVSSYTYSSFDAGGRVLGGTQTTDGQAYSMGYSYDLTGNMTSQTYPSGRVVTSEYDAAGRLAGVVKNHASGLYYAGAAATDSTNRIQYTAHGGTSIMRLGNGLWEHTNFNSRLQPTQIGLGTASANSSVLQLDYGYGTSTNNGNVLSQTLTVPGLTLSQTYSYNQLNRLETALENAGSSWTQNFSHDRFGNRNFAAGTTWPAQLNSANNPVINPNNNRIDAEATGQTNYSYDRAGNLTQDAFGHPFAYDAENRQTTYDGGAASNGGATYLYDGDGRRVKKVVGGPTIVSTVFVYNVAGQLVAEFSNATPSGTGGTRYLTSDTLGSPRVITGTNQGVQARHDYLPFGEEVPTGTGGRTTAQGYASGDNTRQKFTSKERDNETGQDYFLARYYLSTQGRFTSPDPYKIVAEAQYEADREQANSMLIRYLMQPQLWNQYPYAINNPLKYTDPTGEIIELTGTEEQKAALARLRAVLGEERFALVRQSTVNGKIQLTIDAKDIYKFAAIGGNRDEKEFSAGMAGILADKRIVELRVAEQFEYKGSNGKTYVGYTGGGCFILSQCGNGGITLNPTQNATGNGNYQIFVHPNAGAAATRAAAGLWNLSGGKGSLVSSNDMVDAHEFGHVSEYWRPRFIDANPRTREPYRPDSVIFENAVRSRYPSSIRRTRH